jgi:anti-anti-sigma factor
MPLVQEQVGDVTVVRPEGRIDSVTAAQFQAELLGIVQGVQLVVIDGTNINYVSSAGLRVFLMAAKMAQAKGGKVSLSGLSGGVEEIFVVSGFSKIISIYPALEQALA